MNKRRLLRLAQHLDTVPHKNFDMVGWKSRCGTVACACGHAGDIPEFNEEGYFVLRDDNGVIQPMFKEYLSWEAVEEFFELTYRESGYLFCDESYEPGVSPGEVAERIRAVVAEGVCHVDP